MTAGSLIFNLNPEIYQQGVLQDVIYKLLKIFLFSEKNIYISINLTKNPNFNNETKKHIDAGVKDARMNNIYFRN